MKKRIVLILSLIFIGSVRVPLGAMEDGAAGTTEKGQGIDLLVNELLELREVNELLKVNIQRADDEKQALDRKIVEQADRITQVRGDCDTVNTEVARLRTQLADAQRSEKRMKLFLIGTGACVIILGSVVYYLTRENDSPVVYVVEGVKDFTVNATRSIYELFFPVPPMCYLGDSVLVDQLVETNICMPNGSLVIQFDPPVDLIQEYSPGMIMQLLLKIPGARVVTRIVCNWLGC